MCSLPTVDCLLPAAGTQGEGAGDPVQLDPVPGTAESEQEGPGDEGVEESQGRLHQEGDDGQPDSADQLPVHAQEVLPPAHSQCLPAETKEAEGQLTKDFHIIQGKGIMK